MTDSAFIAYLERAADNARANPFACALLGAGIWRGSALARRDIPARRATLESLMAAPQRAPVSDDSDVLDSLIADLAAQLNAAHTPPDDSDWESFALGELPRISA